MDFLKKLSINDDHNSTAAPVHSEEGHQSKGEHLLNKMSDVLGSHSSSQPTSSESYAHSQPKEDHLLNKIANSLGNTSSHSTPAPPKEEHLLDKISNAFGHSPPPPPPAPKHDGLLGKIEDVVGHMTKDNTPSKPQTFQDKIDNMLGGGAKGEAKEDVLDKAIDFVQEHVLKQGQQKNESAIEQLKDEQIALAIRHGFKSATGKELPSLDLPGHKKYEE